MGGDRRGDRDFWASSAAASSTWPTSSGSPRQTLDAIASARAEDGRPASVATFQVVCCIDEREESFRRHLEEIAPDVETFGAAGFYSVAMYYRGAADAHFSPLCPVVIRPAALGDRGGRRTEPSASHRRRARARRRSGRRRTSSTSAAGRSRSGALLTGAVGVLAGVPAGGPDPLPPADGQHPPVPSAGSSRRRRTPGCGSSGASRRPARRTATSASRLEEMTNIGERLLRDMGLTSGFARLLIFLGHGSNSLNNPHNSAYNCGACGGSRRRAQRPGDGPDPQRSPRPRGAGRPGPGRSPARRSSSAATTTPATTRSLLRPGPHPASRTARSSRRPARSIDATCDRNAHERCRRFMSAPLTMSFAEAQQHVEERSEDLPRPAPSWATRPTRSPSSAAASGPAACSSTAARS